ncbi:MAG: DUF2934 domain-containing protein [Burkholderiales bacterium]
MRPTQHETHKQPARPGPVRAMAAKRPKRPAGTSASPPSESESPENAPVFDYLPRCPREEYVRTCAYFKSEQRGFAPGFELEDWLAAETEYGEMLEQSAKDGP